MSYTSLLIGILVIILLVIAAYHFLSADASGRKLWRDEQGEVVAIGEREPSSGQISGRGTQTSAPLQLAAGSYRIDYQFDALTRLALIGAGDEETLLIKSGSGSDSFTLVAAGRYRLQVEPADEGAAWWVTYRQIGK
jgi:hypothetical protein